VPTDQHATSGGHGAPRDARCGNIVAIAPLPILQSAMKVDRIDAKKVDRLSEAILVMLPRRR
jgi:hypothetical protein